MDKNRSDSWNSLIKKMRSGKYDIAIDLSAVETYKAALKRWMFFRLLGVPQTFGRNTNGRGWGFSKRAEDILTSEEHEVIRKLKVTELLGLTGDVDAAVLTVPEAETEYAEEMFADWLNSKELIIGINPGAFRPSRMLPEERFKQLAEWFIDNLSANIVLTGGDKEKAVVDRIAASLPGDRVKTVTGISIMKLAAVMKRMNLLITNDTGPMHIAAAVGAPIVAIFGQTNLCRYHPYLDDLDYIAIKKEVTLCPYYSFDHPMQECRRHYCEDNRCMNTITLDEVREAAEKVLSGQRVEVLV